MKSKNLKLYIIGIAVFVLACIAGMYSSDARRAVQEMQNGTWASTLSVLEESVLDHPLQKLEFVVMVNTSRSVRESFGERAASGLCAQMDAVTFEDGGNPSWVLDMARTLSIGNPGVFQAVKEHYAEIMTELAEQIDVCQGESSSVFCQTCDSYFAEFPDDKDTAQALTRLIDEKLRDGISSAEDPDSIEGLSLTINYLSKANFMQGSEELQGRTDSFTDLVYQTVEKRVAQYKYAAAKSMFEAVCANLPQLAEDSRFENVLSKNAPTRMVDIKGMNPGGFEQCTEDIVGADGKTYSGGNLMFTKINFLYGNKTAIVLPLNKEYTHLSGTIVLGSTTSDNLTGVALFAGTELDLSKRVGNTGRFGKKSESKTIDIDVTGLDSLYIYTETQDWVDVYVYLSDFELYK